MDSLVSRQILLLSRSLTILIVVLVLLLEFSSDPSPLKRVRRLKEDQLKKKEIEKRGDGSSP